MLRALWIGHRWIGVGRPKVWRIAFDSALAPSMMKRRQTAGSSPRALGLPGGAGWVAVSSVAPSTTASGCLLPSLSMPTAATSVSSSRICSPSIWIASRSNRDRSDDIHAAIRSADNSTNRRETADLDRLSPNFAGTSPSGRRTARPNRRVETFSSIRFIAHLPSQSSARAASQLGKPISPPSRRRTRGRSTSIVPPWKPSRPVVRPQRWPALWSDRPWRGPQSRSLSSSIISVRLAIPAVRQKRSKLSQTICQAPSTTVLASLALVVIILFMALLSFSWIRHPEPNSSRRATPLLLFQQPSGHSPCPASPVHYQHDPVQTTKTSVLANKKIVQKEEFSMDRLAIRDLLENWAVWHDAADWERLSTVWHEGGRMITTWFQGTGDEFIKVSREEFKRGVRILHFLGGSSIDIEGERAIAQTKMTMSRRA